MEYEEIELAAARGNPLPPHPDLETLYCYTLLRILYHDYYQKAVDLKTARQKKQEIRQAFFHARELHARYAAAYAQYQEFIRLGGKYVQEIRAALKGHADASQVNRFCLRLYGALTGDSTASDILIERLEELQNEN